ncbi:Uncharacterized protein APZ42_019124 [Daphnia magna]|uniref:Uncharacterized protein n=1 Tax=Daphnia magna TaxID=35525 RepID=A0A164YK23_9CRUS|nr:Uncharacterized protein APZ42_019124 [Daphnia magna]
MMIINSSSELVIFDFRLILSNSFCVCVCVCVCVLVNPIFIGSSIRQKSTGLLCLSAYPLCSSR